MADHNLMPKGMRGVRKGGSSPTKMLAAVVVAGAVVDVLSGEVADVVVRAAINRVISAMMSMLMVHQMEVLTWLVP